MAQDFLVTQNDLVGKHAISDLIKDPSSPVYMNRPIGCKNSGLSLVGEVVTLQSQKLAVSRLNCRKPTRSVPESARALNTITNCSRVTKKSSQRSSLRSARLQSRRMTLETNQP